LWDAEKYTVNQVVYRSKNRSESLFSAAFAQTKELIGFINDKSDVYLAIQQTQKKIISQSPRRVMGSLLAFCPQSRHLLAVCQESHTLTILNLKRFTKRTIQFDNLDQSGYYSVDWSPNGQEILKCGGDQYLRVVVGKTIFSLDNGVGNVLTIAKWDSSGTKIAAGSVDGSIFVWSRE
jgi:WD40 repeat protein